MQIQILVIGLAVFFISILVELSIFSFKPAWQHKTSLAIFSIILSCISVFVFMLYAFSAAAILFALICVYRYVNSMRLVQNRMHEQYLRNTCERTFYWLDSGQLLCVILWLMFYILPPVFSGRSALIVICISLAVGGVFVLFNTIRSIYQTKVNTTLRLANSELPTLTLAIAARNENKYLEECLVAAIASSYPKLEIIVLDDCSQDHTADIIKSFAHDGVRFVQGQKPNKELWLPKNLAYQTLLDEATGELIMYMGVDVTLEPNSLLKIVELFVNKNVKMMGIMPKRTKKGLLASLIQPMRYWWELALPKYITKHEPVLSSCWIANRNELVKKGAFASVMRAIVPEEYLSTTFAKKPGDYAFVRSSGELNISSSKSIKSQWYTALRIRYPQAHRRPEFVLWRVLIMLYFLVTPFVLLPMLIMAKAGTSSVIATMMAVASMVVSNILVAKVTNPATIPFAIVSFPIVVLIDFVALHISMYRYEFGEVIWKGRNVTAPAMHVIPHLPEI